MKYINTMLIIVILILIILFGIILIKTEIYKSNKDKKDEIKNTINNTYDSFEYPDKLKTKE